VRGASRGFSPRDVIGRTPAPSKRNGGGRRFRTGLGKAAPLADSSSCRTAERGCIAVDVDNTRDSSPRSDVVVVGAEGVGADRRFGRFDDVRTRRVVCFAESFLG